MPTPILEGVNWPHLIAEIVFIGGPVLAGGYIGYRKLWWILNEHRPHTHVEHAGPLHAEGILYPRSMNGGDKK